MTTIDATVALRRRAGSHAERLTASRARSGRDLDAGDIYRRLAPVVLGYLRSNGVRDPEDLTGEVFFHVARDLRRFRGDEEALRRWVFTIAHHRLTDHRRRLAARPQESSAPVPDQATPAGEEPVDPTLLAALRQLTDDQREVVVLRFVADLSLDDVAKITRRKVGAVKSLQARALVRLQELLGSA